MHLSTNYTCYGIAAELMYPSMAIIMKCFGDGWRGRSTKGASRQRRSLINSEIVALRQLLPVSDCARQRLSQLQTMSLACVFIRKYQLLGPRESVDNSLPLIIGTPVQFIKRNGHIWFYLFLIFQCGLNSRSICNGVTKYLYLTRE